MTIKFQLTWPPASVKMSHINFTTLSLDYNNSPINPGLSQGRHLRERVHLEKHEISVTSDESSHYDRTARQLGAD